jgi:Methyltransferase domain
LDWIGQDVRQVLIETHRLPAPGQNLTYKGVVLPDLQPSDFFDEFEKNGFGTPKKMWQDVQRQHFIPGLTPTWLGCVFLVLFHREVNSDHSLGRCYEWSFMRMTLAFFAVDMSA